MYPLSRAQRLIAAAKATGYRDDVTEPAAAKEEIRALCHSALARFGDTDEGVRSAAEQLFGLKWTAAVGQR